jgi:signal peptide peptidase-like protein 2B
MIEKCEDCLIQELGLACRAVQLSRIELGCHFKLPQEWLRSNMKCFLLLSILICTIYGPLVCADSSSSQLILINLVPSPQQPSSSSFSTALTAIGASFGSSISAKKTTIKLRESEPRDACDAKKPVYQLENSGYAEIIQRGNCNFTDKALLAQRLGYQVAIIVNNDKNNPDALFVMGTNDPQIASAITIPVLMISHNQGKILTEIVAQGAEISVEFHKYVWRAWDNAFPLMALLAISVVSLSAWFAAAKERENYKVRTGIARISAPQRANSNNVPDLLASQGVQYIDQRAAASFVAIASLSLLLMFYFIEKVIYILFFLFIVGSAQALAILLGSVTNSIAPNYNRNVLLCGAPVDLFSVLAFLPSAALAIGWFFTRKSHFAWILQDILCISLLLIIQHAVRLPNAKIGCILLSLLFVYDIFWVFLSPFFFSGRSVMVTVATGGDTGEVLPVLLKIPRFSDELRGYSMLGMGDLALPGLFISFLLRFDYFHANKGQFPFFSSSFLAFPGYFLLSLVGYSFGLMLCFLALVLSGAGQPALLYIVPAMIGLVGAVAKQRGEWGQLWRGIDAENGRRGGVEQARSSTALSNRQGYSSVNTQEEAGSCQQDQSNLVTIASESEV